MAITDWYWKPTLPKATDGSDIMYWDLTFQNEHRDTSVPLLFDASSGLAPAPTPTNFGSGNHSAILVPTQTGAPQVIDIVPIDTQFAFQKHGRLSFFFPQSVRRDVTNQWGYLPDYDVAFIFYIQDAGTDTVNQPLAPDSKNPRGCFMFRVAGTMGSFLNMAMEIRAVPWDLGEPLTPTSGTVIHSAPVGFGLTWVFASIEWVTNFGSNVPLSSNFATPDQPQIDFVIRSSGPNDRRPFSQVVRSTHSINYTSVAVGDVENLNRGRPGNVNAGLVEPLGTEMFRGTPVGMGGVVWELLGSDELVIVLISEDWELPPAGGPATTIQEEDWELGPPGGTYNTILEETWEPEAMLSTFTLEKSEDWET